MSPDVQAPDKFLTKKKKRQQFPCSMMSPIFWWCYSIKSSVSSQLKMSKKNILFCASSLPWTRNWPPTLVTCGFYGQFRSWHAQIQPEQHLKRRAPKPFAGPVQWQASILENQLPVGWYPNLKLWATLEMMISIFPHNWFKKNPRKISQL